MITINQLTNGEGGANFSSVTTAPISPSPARLILVTVVSKINLSDPNIPSISGCGLGWTLVKTILQDNSQHVRVSVFRALSLNAITAGSLTISFGGQTQDRACWGVTELLGVVTTGTNGSDAIVQSATSATTNTTNSLVTLSPFASVNNATIGIFGALFLAGTITNGAGFSEVFIQHSAETVLEAEFKNVNDTTIDWTYTSGYAAGVIGMEIAAMNEGAALLALL